MSTVRSPNYPSLDLGAAIEAMRPVLKAENRNKMSRKVLAKHLGYSSLNGRALGKIGAVRAYGLLDGSGDELRVSDDAVVALVAPSEETRLAARQRLAMKPTLFQEIRKAYPDTLPSEDNIAFWLMQRQFTEDAAGKAAKNYLTSMRLATGESGAYNPASDVEEEDPVTPAEQPEVKSRQPIPPAPPKAGMLQEVFTLDEGPVTLTFPALLSGESYQDLADHIDLFLRKASRRAGSYYIESYDPKGNRAEKHWSVVDGKEALSLVKSITAEGKIARIRCPLDVDPKYLQELAAIGAQRF